MFRHGMRVRGQLVSHIFPFHASGAFTGLLAGKMVPGGQLDEGTFRANSALRIIHPARWCFTVYNTLSCTFFYFTLS